MSKNYIFIAKKGFMKLYTPTTIILLTPFIMISSLPFTSFCGLTFYHRTTPTKVWINGLPLITGSIAVGATIGGMAAGSAGWIRGKKARPLAIGGAIGGASVLGLITILITANKAMNTSQSSTSFHGLDGSS